MTNLIIQLCDGRFTVRGVTKQTKQYLSDKEIMQLGLWDRYNNVKTIFETAFKYGDQFEPKYKATLYFFLERKFPNVNWRDQTAVRQLRFNLDQWYDEFIALYTAKK